MKLFGTNLLVWVLMVGSLSSERANCQTVESYTVSAFEKRTGGFWCMGGVVSKNRVITSCRCIGSFLEKNVEQFVEISPKNYKVKTPHGVEYSLAKVIKHSHCAVSYMNYTVNDLGGWKIKGSFDDRIKNLVPLFDRGIKFPEAEDRINKCYVLLYAIPNVKIIEIDATGNNFDCFFNFCQKQLSTKGHGCDSFITSLFGAELQCGYTNSKSGVVRGSPVFCNLMKEDSSVFYAAGLAGWSDNKFTFWTTFDQMVNRDFYTVLAGARAGRVSLNVLVISIIINLAIPLFQ